ncbi:hypothetical protein CDL12_08717 [Handroanthus impetiginosus]|uniref:Uncharacterized protein n=1 Tax=Handroanthus impetiginosus TaxID=429701 RepID=A0A2G9HM81_9LAMI|nr:hypothetical protein CDL12_08717 [Handroanthus impetiginosus]
MRSLTSKDEGYRKGYIIWGFAFVFMVLLGIYGALEPVNEAAGSQERLLLSKGNYAATARKLLTNSSAVSKEDDDDDSGDGAGNNSNGDGSTNRVGMGSSCSKDSILVIQGATSPLPNGIPTYTVEIQNACVSESCSISDIHLSCGWFSSARLINPRIFRRIEYDDCLVNDGEPLNPGEALSFQYANTFEYPLSVSSVSCQ